MHISSFALSARARFFHRALAGREAPALVRLRGRGSCRLVPYVNGRETLQKRSKKAPGTQNFTNKQTT
ncbi:hypothetical protein Aduo_002401 [Ancylostoma duodenale]